MDSTINDLLTFGITLLAVSYGLMFLVRLLGRGRPDFSIGKAVAAAVAVRIIASLAVSLTSIERFLRGGDELGFLRDASEIADSSFGSELWTDALTGALYEFTFATQLAIMDSPDIALRMTQIGIAVAGLVLMATAVYELAGAKAATIAMWVLALEPTNIFFSSILHKEPLMMLAGGLVAYGGALAWNRAEMKSILIIALGCLVGVATRPYAGWFLIAAGALIILHAGIRGGGSSAMRRISFVATVIALVAITAPTVLEATTDENLEREIQGSQDANAADDEANLSLEQVDFSTRGAILTNLHQRVADVLTRPYIWQIENSAQQFAVLGSLFALAVLFLLFRGAVTDGRALLAKAGPLLYVASGLLVAYSLSAGNAGTAFRYRTHVVAVAVAALVAYLVSRRQEAAAANASPEGISHLQEFPGPLGQPSTSLSYRAP